MCYSYLVTRAPFDSAQAQDPQVCPNNTPDTRATQVRGRFSLLTLPLAFILTLPLDTRRSRTLSTGAASK